MIGEMAEVDMVQEGVRTGASGSAAARRRRERGSGPVSAILLMGFIALVAAVGLVMWMTVAGQRTSHTQYAADAAALAGADAALDELPDLLGDTFDTVADLDDAFSSGCSQFGSSDAADLAAANGAELTDYCYDLADGTVSVTVRAQQPVRGQQVLARAEAETGLDLDGCLLDPDFTVPEPEPEPDPEDSDEEDAEEPERPEPVDTTIDCGFGAIEAVFDPEDEEFSLDLGSLVDLLDELEPRLTA
ncbi:hypothetical protein [Desertihabitans aurantiacus]|uniref:hypothetical protein n=1 Tax=Desertihabitans aurantiacus TaxID=2282477 RepID=UPI000DF727D3|nr:hypothetical protein [Desertihabitans aurantiacus]